VRISELGGLGVLNAEGLWARHTDPKGALERVVAAATGDEPDSAVALLQELHQAPIQRT
jgi:IMP dehydrogenase